MARTVARNVVAQLIKPGKHPTILVIQEIFGVHAHIQDMCRRFAKLGYYAIAPELFARQGDMSKMTDIGAILKDVVSKVPDPEVMSDLRLGGDHLRLEAGARLVQGTRRLK